jgi:DNA (cytosine-5)-methyltransferase 1
MSLTLYDEFAGWGGSSQGCTAVPGVELIFAANHDKLAIAVHSMNFPDAGHYDGDVARARIETFPRADLFWASPVCPPWSNARGKRRDFDRSTETLPLDGTWGPERTEEEKQQEEETRRARALMEEVPRYLGAMRLRGKPVLAGVVENVIECRKWAEFDRWLNEIRGHGYKTRLIALNSMHARGRNTPRAPQSRDRMYVAYWLTTLPDPDWDKWLRPRAWCPSCDEWVDAMQVFKRPSNDMGRYGIRNGQYVYRCPRSSCRHRMIEPQVQPATTAIDWTLHPGPRIGDRPDLPGVKALEPATIARIQAGLDRFAPPFLVPAGGTWRDTVSPLDEPMPTRTTRDTDGLVTGPLLVPTTGREGKQCTLVAAPLPTQTCRRELGLTIPPFMVQLRGGGCREHARAITEPLGTFSAQGNHHGLVNGLPEHLLVPYYSTGVARPVEEPLGTLTTKDRYGLLGYTRPVQVEDCTFRMLEPEEIARGMAFRPGYRDKGSKRARARGYGNAVTPPSSEITFSALVEAIAGEDLERAA